jgi:hypothetical protein
MRHTLVNYFLLILTITLSFLAICTFDFYPGEPYDKSLDNFRLFTPGVLYSLFIVILQRSNWALGKLILYFFILVIIYLASLIAGLSSWGVAVPFAGGFGAVVIKKLFYQNAGVLDSTGGKYLMLGFAAGLIGLCLYYLLHDKWTDGVGFGFILVTWQLAFGLLWVKKI